MLEKRPSAKNMNNWKFAWSQSRKYYVILRGHVARDFEVRGTLFRPPSNYGSNQFFSLKTAWGSHPNGFQRSKRRVSGLSEFFFQKSRRNQAKMKIGQKRWKKAKNGFLWLPNIVCNYFLLPGPVKRAKKAIFGLFGRFLVIFGVPPSSSKKSGSERLKSRYSCLIW